MERKNNYISLGVTVFLTAAAILLFYDTFFGGKGLLALLETLSPSWELVLCTQNEEDWQQLQNILWAVGPKNGFILVKTSQNQERLAKIAPFTQPSPIPTGEGQCYLCKNGTCMQPQTLSQLANLLQC